MKTRSHKHANEDRNVAAAQPLQKKKNKTGMSDTVKEGMETAFNTDFSDVRVHAGSSKAPEVGALAYTQGSNIHFAPGQFNQDSSTGKQLLGHELTHVVQQREGRVQATTEVGGMPVNDDVSLEKEADDRGSKVSIQQMPDNRPETVAQHTIQGWMHNSPTAAAQRKQIDAISGVVQREGVMDDELTGQGKFVTQQETKDDELPGQ